MTARRVPGTESCAFCADPIWQVPAPVIRHGFRYHTDCAQAVRPAPNGALAVAQTILRQQVKAAPRC